MNAATIPNNVDDSTFLLLYQKPTHQLQKNLIYKSFLLTPI